MTLTTAIVTFKILVASNGFLLLRYELYHIRALKIFLFKGTVDPAFRLMRFPLDGELDFYFEKMIFI